MFELFVHLVRILKKKLINGNFREDLYHRLNVFEINIDSLKNRTSDISFIS